MPSSYIDSVAPIVHLLCSLKPNSVLDVGPGWGKYGLLVREYIHELERLDAIEVPEGRMETQPAIYDGITYRDVTTINPEYFANYDIIMLIDVIEHLKKDDGFMLLRSMVDAGAQVLVSTPKTFFEQHDPNNPYEDHLSHWTWQDFAAFDIMHDISTIDSIIYLLC